MAAVAWKECCVYDVTGDFDRARKTDFSIVTEQRTANSLATRPQQWLCDFFCLRTFSSCSCARREQFDASYVIQEEQPSNFLIGNLAHDTRLADSYSDDQLDRMRFTFLDPGVVEATYFALEYSTGVLRTAMQLDRDVICRRRDVCRLSFDVAVAPSEFLQLLKVQVELVDLNDNSPTFEHSFAHFVLPESASPGKRLLLPSVEDPDSRPFSISRIRLESSGNDVIPFRLEQRVLIDNSTQLHLELTSNVDREQTASYRFDIVAEDGGVDPRVGHSRRQRDDQ